MFLAIIGGGLKIFEILCGVFYSLRLDLYVFEKLFSYL